MLARISRLGVTRELRTWYDTGSSPSFEFCSDGLPDWAPPTAPIRMGPRLLVLSSVAAVVFVACGGSSPGDLFASDASDDGGSTRVSDGATTGSDGSAKVDGAVPSDGGLACGATTCKIPLSEICCVARAGGSWTFACVAGATCPSTGGGNQPTALKCASAADCSGGTVCCVTQANNQTVSACKTACGNNDAQLCDSAASPTGCAANAPCSSNKIGDWDLPPPFATCGGKGG